MTRTPGSPVGPRSSADGVELMAMTHDVNLLAAIGLRVTSKRKLASS
jgi:hypothetical protein